MPGLRVRFLRRTGAMARRAVCGGIPLLVGVFANSPREGFADIVVGLWAGGWIRVKRNVGGVAGVCALA